MSCLWGSDTGDEKEQSRSRGTSSCCSSENCGNRCLRAFVLIFSSWGSSPRRATGRSFHLHLCSERSCLTILQKIPLYPHRACLFAYLVFFSPSPSELPNTEVSTYFSFPHEDKRSMEGEPCLFYLPHVSSTWHSAREAGTQ